MITIRRERIAYLGIFILVITFLTWKVDYFGSEPDNTIQYQDPLTRPELTTTTKEDVTVAATNTQTTGATDTTTAKTDTTTTTTTTSTGDKKTDTKKTPEIGHFTEVPKGAHAMGFTVFDNLYLRGGTFYILTPDVTKFPHVEDMISLPNELDDKDLTPTAKEMQFLAPADVDDTLGKHAVHIDGVTVIVYDPPQFLNHLYHWWGEIILGAWRVLSFEGSKKEVVMPKRFIIPFSDDGAYRDPAGVDAPLMRAAFPNALIEESDYWDDLIKLDATVVFDRVMLVNRPAAHRHPLAIKWNKMIAGSMDVNVPDNFWTPVRQILVENILGYVPKPEKNPATVYGSDVVQKPLVTYISRQKARTRHLEVADHEALVKALANLEKEGICDFVEAKMEDLSLREQVKLAARSTILIGVHGNGLTHQLWMPSSTRSTVFEIFNPDDYLFDYELLARNAGHKHYAVWKDKVKTYPKGTPHDGILTTKEFHGTSIPVDAASLVKVVKERLAEKLP